MSKIVIKGIMLKGRYSGPADKYIEPPPGPTHFDIGGELRGTYKKIEEFLKSNGKIIVPELINILPYIKDGIISAPIAASCYIFNDCLVANGFRPYYQGVAHVIQTASKLETESAIDETFKVIKDEAGWEWREYWKIPYECERKIIDAPEQLENIT